jgi:hypothetical protein
MTFPGAMISRPAANYLRSRRRNRLAATGPRSNFATLVRDATSNGAVPASGLNLSSWPDMSFVMQGADGSDVTLTCAPATYWQTDAPQPGDAMFQINNRGNFPMSILGLLLFNNYYTVFDRSQNPYGTISFAPIATPAKP